VIDYYLIIFILIAAGFGCGVIVGIGSGTAGGLLIPIFIIFLGSSIHNAIGTSLVVDCIIGLVAGLIFLKRKNVDLQSVLLLAFPGVIGAFIGSRFTSVAAESDLSIFIGIILILLGINFVIYGIRKNVSYIKSKVEFKFFKNYRIPTLIVLGFIVGLMSGFSGISGGAIIALFLIFAIGFPIHLAVGTSLLVLFFVGGSGAFGHIINNQIIVNAAVIAGVAAAAGAISGSILSNRINENKLGRLIGVIMLILGIALIIRIF